MLTKFSLLRQIRTVLHGAFGLTLVLCLVSLAPGGAALGQVPGENRPVDFDATLKALKFNPATVDGNLDPSGKGNGLLDADEMALVAALLNDPDLDLRSHGGVSHGQVKAAYDQALTSATVDTQRLLRAYPAAPQVVAGYALLGQGSFEAFNAMIKAFGAPLKGDYSQALALQKFLAPDGDADGDGLSNRTEYAGVSGQGRNAYVQAALSPDIRPKASASLAQPPVSPQIKRVGVVLYPGFELLDVFGPVEMWANTPGFEIILIAEQAGPVTSAQGPAVTATHGFATAPDLDIMMVPGGIGTTAQLENPVLLDFLRRQDRHTEFTTSVCTGSALLARAGLLKGRRATSNKAYFSLATSQDASVDWIKKARWVEDGKLFTSSGVSAGTDMALALVARIHGTDQARSLARSLEYQWSEDADNDPFAIQ